MTLTIENDKRVWVTSDPHYSHRNICRGTTVWRKEGGEIPIESTRDFATVEDMNRAIVDNINRIVQKQDVLICLGDWSFNGPENVGRFRQQLNCENVHLVLGNHDKHIEKDRWGLGRMFSSVSDYLRLTYMDYKIECFHYPIESWRGKHNKYPQTVHIHGHCHLPHDKKVSGQRMDVGMDGHPEFRPYDLLNEVILPLTNSVTHTGNSLD